MQRTFVVAVVLVVSSVAYAQPKRNRVEKARDRQDLRQDARQVADDTMDAQRAAQLLRDYDAAAIAGDVGRLNALDLQFNGYLARELAESRVEQGQKQQEVREDRRELASDRRELRRDVRTGQGGAAVGDLHDQRRDRANLADDRGDATRERLSRGRLLAIQSQLGGLSGRFDPASVGVKRQLYAEVLTLARAEVAGDKAEQKEDRRELREDRRETREDRRSP